MKTAQFKNHLLKEEKLSQRSISEHELNLCRFKKWATAQHIDGIDHLTYTEILGYVQYQQQQKIQAQTINVRLNTIKKYYEYLKHIGIIDKNPARKILIKGTVKTITQNVLSYTELEQLYNDYQKYKPEIRLLPISIYTRQKNILLAGLLIWQGAVSGEIEKMTLDHVNLTEGLIKIPKTRRGASREIKLLPVQILQLHKYIHEARPFLIKYVESCNGKKNSVGEKLIPGIVGNHLTYILAELKGINQKIKNASQLRTSIIIHWLKVYGKRQAQYMAGHKHIHSTERFEMQEIESLTDTLLKHHPFN